VNRVGAIADGAETIESRNAEGRGEVAIGAAAGHAFAERQAHLRGKRLGAGEKCGANFALERRAVEAAANFQFRTVESGP
jgi:hypothetical protein